MDQPTIFRYEPSIEMDLAVAGMWTRMHRDGDLADLFTRDSQSLEGIFRIVRPPGRGLLFCADERGVWFAMWLEQTMGAAFLGMWVAKDRRQRRETLDVMVRAYDLVLSVFPAILGVTKQPRLLRGHERLGYRVLAQVPGLWDGEDAWLVMLTREAFAAAKGRLGRIRRLEEVG